MRTLIKCGLVSACALLLSHCASGPYPMGGLVFHSLRGPNQAAQGPSGSKQGESCAASVMSIAAWGDASIDAAKKAAAVSTISTVDYSSFNVFGIYRKTCAIVTGS